MSFSEARFGDATLVIGQGRVDMANADAFKDALMAAVEGPGTTVVVDMSHVEYISSAGLRSLMIALRSAKGANKGFAVAGLNALVLEIFTISRFNLVFALFAGVRDALADLAPDGLAAFDAG